jgi:hypothetical protein
MEHGHWATLTLPDFVAGFNSRKRTKKQEKEQVRDSERGRGEGERGGEVD